MVLTVYLLVYFVVRKKMHMHKKSLTIWNYHHPENRGPPGFMGGQWGQEHRKQGDEGGEWWGRGAPIS